MGLIPSSSATLPFSCTKSFKTKPVHNECVRTQACKRRGIRDSHCNQVEGQADLTELLVLFVLDRCATGTIGDLRKHFWLWCRWHPERIWCGKRPALLFAEDVDLGQWCLIKLHWRHQYLHDKWHEGAP